MKNKLLIFFFLLIPFIHCLSQTIDASYLNPILGSSEYKFLRFGNDAEYTSGFMWNKTNLNYGDGDDFSIFTYNNRDITFRTGTGNLIVFPTEGGNMGVGTKNPLGKLHLKGNLYLDGNESVNGWGKTRVHWKGHSLIFGTLPGRYAHNLIELKPGGSTSGELYSSMEFYQAIGENNHEKRIRITSHSSYPTFFNAGNVGIGTEDPGSWKLAVNGKIRAKEIKVETVGWSDFVFEKDYNLPTLEEVDQHIKQKGHLKDIPSAKEVAENGIFLGKMDAKLLQKIEELTLYTIEQQKLIERQEAMLIEMKEEIENLKKRKR
ncbi:hypothetical protein HX109_10770 [Galbibacter sp. BG1]|uniref:hypothetical protein n=1 Tax=Galbibacter sp. BG1 TaxID=1170699 RepID=UPI0015BD9643|nr:hypothetical protein [Galbibacter sp. BG1]QLE02012.1 hypothetical protein HX109_10770 [Galbibacter sp. BG1]